MITRENYEDWTLTKTFYLQIYQIIQMLIQFNVEVSTDCVRLVECK